MKIFGRHSYFQAREIKPGSLYLANRSDDTYFVLGVEPAIKHDSTAILIIKQISGNAFSGNYIVVAGERFALRSQFVLINDSMIVPSHSVETWKSTAGITAPTGSLYSINGSIFLVSKDVSGETLLVDCGNGSTTTESMRTNLWTSDWTIRQKDDNDEWISIFSR